MFAKKNKKFGFWTAFRIAGILLDGISGAAVDGKLTVREGIEIIAAVCRVIGIDFDTTGVGIDE